MHLLRRGLIKRRGGPAAQAGHAAGVIVCSAQGGAGGGSRAGPGSTRILTIRTSRCDEADLRRLRELCQQWAQSGPRRLVLDLTHIRRADTKLVAILVYALRLARRNGIRLEVRLSEELEELLELCHVRRLLRGDPTGRH